MRSSPTRSSSPVICLQVLVHQRRIFLLDRHARTDRASADAEIAQVVRRLTRATERAVDRTGVRRELLTEPNRHRVLQVRATRLHDVVELLPFLRQRIAQRLERA